MSVRRPSARAVPLDRAAPQTTTKFSRQHIISRLGQRMPELTTNVVKDIKFMPSKNPSLGRLSDLPLELLYEIFDYLDLQSMSRMSQVSKLGKDIVEAHLPYKHLLSYTRHTFKTLSLTGAISLHSVATLNAALCSDRCVSCGTYGEMLLMVSAKRSCRACLLYNQSHWMITLSEAQDYFKLTEEESDRLPAIWSGLNTPENPLQILTTVRAAKELAIGVHGSMKALTPYVTKIKLSDIRLANKTKWFHNAPLEPLQHDPLILSRRVFSRFLESDRVGMGTIQYPSYSKSGGIQTGIQCRGCIRTFKERNDWAEPNADVLKEAVSREVQLRAMSSLADFHEVLFQLKLRCRTESELLEHQKHCFSADFLLEMGWVDEMVNNRRTNGVKLSTLVRQAVSHPAVVLEAEGPNARGFSHILLYRQH